MEKLKTKDLINETDAEYMKDCIDADVLKEYDDEVIIASYYCNVQPYSISECYQGEFKSDEEFVKELLGQYGDIPIHLQQYVHIDWERNVFVGWNRTVSDVMNHYIEHNGHYFTII